MIARFDTSVRRTPVLAPGFGLLLRGGVVGCDARRRPERENRPGHPHRRSSRQIPSYRQSPPTPPVRDRPGSSPAGSPAGAVPTRSPDWRRSPLRSLAIRRAGRNRRRTDPAHRRDPLDQSPATVTLSPEEEKANARTAAKRRSHYRP